MKVLVTGSGGTIGAALRRGLPQHDITEFDLPHYDVKNREQLIEMAKGHDVIIHLAWDFNNDGWLGENLNPANVLMTHNVYEAATLAGVKRVIMASSVHADRFTRQRGKNEPLRPFDLPLPDSPYGASKVLMESLGRYYADSKGLEIVCIRFGSVTKDDTPDDKLLSERRVWLSHRDCVELVRLSLDVKSIPLNYSITYGVSANQGLIHDLSNPFGWHPQDGASAEAIQ
jgi:nucleoside-diphosphate-sugar epimerase